MSPSQRFAEAQGEAVSGTLEVTVNSKKQFRKLATLGAAVALSLQLLAGVANAAVPEADSDTVALPDAYSPGTSVGFLSTYLYKDSSTLSKLVGQLTVTGGSVVSFAVTRND